MYAGLCLPGEDFRAEKKAPRHERYCPTILIVASRPLSLTAGRESQVTLKDIL
jgi:hypothetical protein